FPYNGTTTTFEALWMGVPVLSLKGNNFLSCTAKSLADNVGLSDWVAIDIDDYVNKAVQFASDLDRLAQLRSTLRERVLRSPLFDTPRFARNFGEALWGMWNQCPQSKRT
ncbi:MAG: peptide-binding protein, partial [Quisquiliibacterium sp.]